MKHLKSTACIALFATMLCTLNVTAQVQTARHITVNPNCDGFYEYLPQGYQSETNSYPLIVFIHGLGELGNGTTQLPSILNNGVPKVIHHGQFPATFHVNGQTHKFLVISPQFKNWPSAQDVNAVINYAVQNYRININRIYVTGLSMGGGVTWEYAGDNAYATRVAAAVPVCGASWPDQLRAQVIASNHVAVWATHNEGDWTVPVWYTNNYISYINSSNPNPVGKKSIWPINSHDAWTRTYDPNYRENGVNIYEWMLQYTKGSPSNQPPSVNAGNPQTITLPVNSVILNGNAWDNDGNITSYNWSKVSGPSATIVSPSSNNTQVNNLSAGTYVFKLTATDNQGAFNSSNVQVTVNPAAPLSVYAGPNQTITLPTNRAQLTSSVTPANANVTYRWSQVEGPAQASFNNRRVANPIASNLSVGTYKFKVRVRLNNNNSNDEDDDDEDDDYNDNQNSDAASFVYVTVQPAPPPASSNRIEAEHYVSMSGIQTENTYDAGGGQNVGWIENGDWMNYTINAPTAGSYTIKLRVASPNSNTQFQIKKLDGTVLSTVNVPNTGGWQNWNTIPTTINLTQGSQIIRLQGTTWNGWNINWFEFSGTGTTPPPSGGGTTTSKIEAESYTAMNGVQSENTSDAGGGLNLGWMDNGDWMDYNVNVATAGTYTLKFRLAAGSTGAQFQVKKADGSVLATVNVPTTGGWQNWQTVSVTATLPAGQQTLRLQSTTWNGWNINWWEIESGGTLTPTTKIEAENWTTMNGVGTEATSDIGGGLNVGWIDNGDWMDYSITIPSSGTYTVRFRVASPNTGTGFHLKKSDGTVLTTVNIPNTGTWQNWQTITATVSLNTSIHTLRLQGTSPNGWNINWLEIEGPSSNNMTRITTGEDEEQGSIKIFPNPASQDRILLTVDNEHAGTMRVLVSDLTGMLKKQFTLTKNNTGSIQSYLSIDDLPKGTYMLKVIMNNWTQGMTIIKQ